MTNEQIIWNFLYEKLHNPYGVAALMGNLMAESSLNPLCANGVSKIGLTNSQYTEQVDNMQYKNFVNDGIAYGLAQWCYKTRKEALLEMSQVLGMSVGDINLQLEYMWIELQKYKTVLETLRNTTSVKEASDIVMLKYERPGNTSETMKQRRASYGENYYKKYSTNTIKLNLDVKTATSIMNEIKKTID